MKTCTTLLIWLIGSAFLFAQDNVMEATSKIHQFDLGFRGGDDLELDLELDMEELADIGKDYALIIAVDDYTDGGIRDLKQPVSDAENLTETLTKYYTFDEKTTTFLKNATRSQILGALEDLSKKITTNDNLLIFYAGHGDWDEKLEIGYWLPSDAVKSDRSTWFPNSTLRDYIAGIQSQHTLLVTDACFAGGILNTRSAMTGASKAIQELYAQKSRRALTSGNLKEVPDNSVFVEYLVRELRRNREVYLPSADLYVATRRTVTNNSPNAQLPQWGPIQGSGDEGGDFIFKRKR